MTKTFTRKDAKDRKLTYGLPFKTAELLCMSDLKLADVFEDTFAETKYVTPEKLAAWVIGEYSALTKKGIEISPAKLAVIADAVTVANIPETFAKKLLASDKWVEMMKDFKPVDDTEIRSVLKDIIEKEPEMFEGYKAGNLKMENHLMGLAMKEFKGKADGAKIRKLLNEL